MFRMFAGTGQACAKGFEMTNIKSRIPARLLLIMMLILSGSSALVMGTASAAFAETNSCSANIQNPHDSASHGGADVTGTWKCSSVTTTIYLAANRFVGGVGFWLWLCPRKPPQSESYLNNSANHCTVKGVSHENITLTKSGVTVARTAPPPSQPAAHGTGWWIACSIWVSNGPHGLGSKVTSFSNAVGFTA